MQEEVPSIKNIKIGNIISSCSFNLNLEEGGLFFVFYEINVDMDEVILGNEHSEYRWISLNELDSIKNNTFEGRYDAIKTSLLKQ